MTRDEILTKVRTVLVDALAVDDEDVTPQASLTKDLGAESIDFLDIQFKLEQAFGFKIGQGEMFPEDLLKNPEFVKDGKVTAAGMTQLRQRLPHINFSTFEQDPQAARLGQMFTVDAVVTFVETKLKKAA
jgi:acyl carrier protein